MKTDTIRIGFIGAGANTRKMHLPGFREIEGVELSVVANRSLASAERVAETEGIARVAPDWRAVVEDPNIDAVCIGTWPYLHAEASIAALKNGKHVLCEARMAADLREAEAMVAAAREHSDQVLQIVPAPFSLAYDATIRDLLSCGGLGRLLEVRVVHTGGQLSDPDAPMSWRQDAALSGQNILTMGIMHETVQRWIGEDPAWVIADGAIFQQERCYPDSTELQTINIPDSVSILGRFAESGARMIYHFSGLESGRPCMEFRLNGTRGSLRFEANPPGLFFAASGSVEEEKIPPAGADAKGWQVEADFVRSIRSEHPVRLTAYEDGLRYMRFTEMVNVSMQRAGARVDWTSRL